MNQSDLNQHLSQIDTLWTMVLNANQGPDAETTAQDQLMQRYGGAVYRYLLALVRDANVADDLAQEFAVRFLRGDFRRVAPERGKFRHFVKAAVRNLVTDHFRRQKTRPKLLPPESPVLTSDETSAPQLEQEFLDSWRNELLTRAWESLRLQAEHSQQPFYVVLKFRADHPELHAAQLAEKLLEKLHKTVTENWVRQILYRARNLFADSLLDDVLQSLDNPTFQNAAEELMELGLHEYCSSVLERRKRGASYH